MAYCGIMRIEKRKSGAIGGICAENTRTEEDRDKKHFDKSDVDWDRTSSNLDMTISRDENGELQVEFSPHKSHGHWVKEYNQQMKDAKSQGMRIRKDSNAMIDGFYGASHDFWSDKLTVQQTDDEKKVILSDAGKEYFADCLKEHVRLYCQGDPTRVHGAVIHLDEAEPHLHCNSDCLYEDEKGLHWSADKICGNKVAFQSRQDRFYEDVTKDWGLDRADDRNMDREGNIVRSADVKKHLTVQEYKEQKTEERTREMQKEQRGLIRKNQKLEQEIENNHYNAKLARNEALEAQNASEDIKTDIYTSLGRERPYGASDSLPDLVEELKEKTTASIGAKAEADRAKEKAEKEAETAKQKAEEQKEAIRKQNNNMTLVQRFNAWIKKGMQKYKESKMHKGMYLVPKEDLQEMLYSQAQEKTWAERRKADKAERTAEKKKLSEWRDNLTDREQELRKKETDYQMFGRFEPAKQKLDRLREKFPEEMKAIEEADRASMPQRQQTRSWEIEEDISR